MSARQWVFDVAHNDHGMQFLLKQLTPYVNAYQCQHPAAKLHLVISMLADKDIEPVLAVYSNFPERLCRLTVFTAALYLTLEPVVKNA